MTLFYNHRAISDTLQKASKHFSAIVLTGPRQSGKTTLLKHLFEETHRYCPLDIPDIREMAKTDPRLLLERFKPPLILDEIQNAPELLHYVKNDIDDHREEPARFVITGSQIFPLMQGVTESLAGRTAVFVLHSMGMLEAWGKSGGATGPFEGLVTGQEETATRAASVEQLADRIFRGGFPELALKPEMDARQWHSAYVQTYLERDVRSLHAMGDLGDFQRFMFLLASRSGALVNFSDLGRDLGVTNKTVKAWVSVLEASGQVTVLKPYHTNLGKRVVKHPKVYFNDTGVLGYLLGLANHGQVLEGALSGLFFESAVFGELLRLFTHRGESPRIWFWRTSSGQEVDFLLDLGGILVPVEAKLTATPSRRHAAGILKFLDLFGSRAGPGLVVTLAPERIPIEKNVTAVPLGSF